MDLLRQLGAQGQGQGSPPRLGPGQGRGPHTQLHRQMGLSRASLKEPTIKIELPVAMFRPPASTAGPEMEAMKQLAARGGLGRPPIPEPPGA